MDDDYDNHMNIIATKYLQDKVDYRRAVVFAIGGFFLTLGAARGGSSRCHSIRGSTCLAPRTRGRATRAPYVIFHDVTLSAIARERPSSADQLAKASGVGQSELKRYGADVLKVVRAWR